MIKQRWPHGSFGIFSVSTQVRSALPSTAIMFKGSLLYCTTSGIQRQKKVPGTSELLIVSPMIPKYTIHNRYLNTSTTVTVEGFDARSLQETMPRGAAAYVQNVSVSTPNKNVAMLLCL